MTHTLSRCQGQVPVGTHVDQAMSDFVTDEAHRLGVSKAELQRRLLEVYQQSRVGQTACEHCGGPVEIELEEI